MPPISYLSDHIVIAKPTSFYGIRIVKEGNISHPNALVRRDFGVQTPLGV